MARTSCPIPTSVYDVVFEFVSVRSNAVCEQSCSIIWYSAAIVIQHCVGYRGYKVRHQQMAQRVNVRGWQTSNNDAMFGNLAAIAVPATPVHGLCVEQWTGIVY